METLGNTLPVETREALSKIGQANAHETDGPTSEQELAVTQTLGGITQRSKGKKHRPSSKQGPITPSEFRDLMNASQSIDETLNNKAFVEGVFEFIRFENKAGDYQTALGELVAKYKAFDAKMQETIRLRLADGKQIPDRRPAILALAKNNVVTALDELLMVLFYDDDSAFEQNANRSLVARKRSKNWSDRYNKVWAEEADSASAEERAEIREKAKEGKATATELAKLQEPLIGQPEKAKTSRGTTDRMTPYSLIANMVLLIGHEQLNDAGMGAKLPLPEQIDLYNKIILLARAAEARFDYTKLDAEVTKRSVGFNDRVIKSADEQAKSDALDIMTDFKAVVASKEREAVETDEPKETETELVESTT